MHLNEEEVCYLRGIIIKPTIRMQRGWKIVDCSLQYGLLPLLVCLY